MSLTMVHCIYTNYAPYCSRPSGAGNLFLIQICSNDRACDRLQQAAFTHGYQPNHAILHFPVFCQAQSQLQFNWTDLALFSFFRLSSRRLVSTGIVSKLNNHLVDLQQTLNLSSLEAP